jgi:hypothetical protein
MENSFSSLIDSAVSVLVVLPTKPYFDQVAAGLSLYLAIHDKKEVSIYCPSPMTVGFNRLVGVNKITSDISNKNLIVRFAGYDANGIDKVSYDIDNGEFKLTVVPKSGLAAPKREEIITSYAGISADLVILVGGANDAHFPILASQELNNAKVAHVGTRVLDSRREVMSFAKSGATTSELAAALIRESGLTLDNDIATNLVMGIEEGSSNFGSPEVTPETFEIFAHLLRSGAQRMPKVRLSPASFPPGAIPTKPFGGRLPPAAVKTPALRPVAQTEPVLEKVEAKEELVENPDEVADINPPADWLQPKIFKSSSTQADSFSENKG